jgi:hypothetical protein
MQVMTCKCFPISFGDNQEVTWPRSLDHLLERGLFEPEQGEGQISLGGRGPGNYQKHLENIAGFGSNFLQCNCQIHVENI